MTDIKQLPELSRYDFPDTKTVQVDEWDVSEVVTATDRNFQILIDNYNTLVYTVNALIDNDSNHTGDLRDLREDVRDLQR